MPVLDPVHDHAHPVEADTAWSESYYFNGYDPDSDVGIFTRVGIRANEGTMDVGLSLWLPDGGLAEYHATTAPPQPVGDVLEVGAVRYELLKPGEAWRLTMDADAPARPAAGETGERRTVHVALDARFEGLMPPVGTDGHRTGPRSAEAAAAASTVGKGHFEQAGRWDGTIELDGERLVFRALGNRDRSWGPRRWGGPTMWRWFSINLGEDLHLGGIRIGTPAGDLHRGWVFDGGRATSVEEWGISTELADDGVTHRVVHLDVRDKSDGRYRLRGDVLRVADIGGRGGTMINEGLARWTLEDRTAPVGYGICEYLHQLDADGRPVVPVE